MRDIEKELNEARRDANNATRYAEPGYANLTAYAKLLEIRALRLTIEKATQKLHEHHRGTWVRFTDHEAAIEQVLADAKARIEGLKFAANVVIRDSSARDYARDYNRAIDDCLAALTQPQTEKCPEDCDGFGRLIGDSDGPCPACSGLESDGGGAATAAGVADAEHERRLETNRLLWNRVARLEEALRVIRGPEDRGPWMLIYRNAGGGYAGLQAIAETALAPEDSEPSPYAKAFRERVCPVPEFPGIEKEES